jgi:AcrR family transcriptional regulator
MKDKIITKAVELFNESGINQTSFRNIASALKVSDGHVRYYFKTKQKLLLAIFEQMNTEILLAACPVPGDLAQITTHLKENLIQAFTIMANYSFFFTETPATFNQFTEVGQYYKNLVKSRKELFTLLFTELTAMGYFKNDFTAELQQQAFYNIFIISDSWIRYHFILHNHKPDQQTVKFHSELAFRILHPYINADIIHTHKQL